MGCVAAVEKLEDDVKIKTRFNKDAVEVGQFDGDHFSGTRVIGEIVEHGNFTSGCLMEGVRISPTITEFGVFDPISKKLIRGRILTDSQISIGEFSNILIRGKIIKFSGKIIEGTFADGKLTNGFKYFSNGEIEEGEFKDGQLVEGSKTLVKKTKITGKFKNKKFIGSKI